MKKSLLLVLFFPLIFFTFNTQIINAKPKVFNNGSIVGVVVARERANGDYSLGVSLNYKTDENRDIDEVRFRLPFKEKTNIGYADKGWGATIKGARVTIKRTDKEKEEDEDPDIKAAIETINFRLDYDDKYQNKITSRLRVPIRYTAYDDGEKVFEDEITPRFFPKISFGFRDNFMFMPGRLSPGEEFTATVNDDVEQFIQFETLSKLEKEFADELRNIKRSVDSLEERTKFLEANQFSTTTKLKGETAFFIDRPGEFDEKEFNFNDRVRLNFDTSFTGEDRFRIRLNGKVPEDVKPGDSLSINYKDRFGELIFKSQLKDTVFIPAPKDCDSFVVRACDKYAFKGRTLCACGCFDESQGNGFTYDGFTLDGKEILPLAGSKTSTTMYLSPDLAPGEHTLTYTNKRGTKSSVKFNVLEVKGAVDQDKLWTGQSTTMRLQIIGTQNKLPIEVENKTPDIIRLTGGDKQVIDTSGGATNLITRGVRGIQRGDFTINYKLDIPPCPCEKELIQ